MTPPTRKETRDWKWLLPTGITVLALIAGSTWKLRDEFSKIDRRIARIETAVRIIGAKQGGDTKTLIDEALAVAKAASDNGRTENAKAAMDIANRLLAERKNAQELAPQEFFDAAITRYKELKKSPTLAQAAWEGTIRLAEYRSATNALPAGSVAVHIGEMSQRGNFRYLRDSLIAGQNAIRTPGCDGFELDGWYIENVVFEDLTICYRGRPAILTNVRFVNCQFDVEESPKAEELMEAAVKESVTVAIG